MVENCIVLIFKVDKILKNIRFVGKKLVESLRGTTEGLKSREHSIE